MPDRLDLGQRLVCPSCRRELAAGRDGSARCAAEGLVYPREGGIWRLLDPLASSHATGFLAYYQTVRRAEGWGAEDDDYYRALPDEDRSGRHEEVWRIRAITHRLFIERVLAPLEAAQTRLAVLDLGAGNGWLSYRLALRGHDVAAVDLNDDARDGLGAHVHYGEPAPFLAVQASFDRLPWADGVADLVIYNGSLHYSADAAATLEEALRVLAPDGRVVILDSPCYEDEASGRAMVREREAAFRAEHGDGVDAVSNEGFLTGARLTTLGRQLGLEWRVRYPFIGVRAALRRVRNRLFGRREQARFPVVAGERAGGSPAV